MLSLSLLLAAGLAGAGALQLVRLGGSDLRADFPILHQTVWDERPLVYLDSAATSQKPRPVLEAMERHQALDNSNVHRGAHLLSVRSTEAYEGARDKVARFVNAFSRDEIIFTRGATEAINLVAQTWGVANLGEGDEVVLTVAEHHSNIVPWQMLAQSKGISLKFAKLDATECVDLQHLQSLITPKTKLVAIAHASNVLGYVNPVAEVVAAAKRVGAAVLLDACQSLPHMPVDVQALGADFVVGSGHKMCGPTGIGFLWGKFELLEQMPPWQGGGEMIRDVFIEGSTFMPPPSRFEAGTPAITQAVGLGAAIDYLNELGMHEIEAYEQRLGKRLYEALSTVSGLRLYGPSPQQQTRTGLCAFNSASVHASDLATFLDQDGVAIRAGHHCAQPLHRDLDAAGSARASLYFYNTEAEIDTLVQSIESTVDMFAALEA